jgi:hypothetical protein
MSETGWDKIADAIDIKYGIDKQGRRTEPLEDNHDLTQQIRFVEFDKDGERYQLRETTRPVIITKKSIFHKAAGSGVTHQNVYDPEELTHITQLYRLAGDDWEAVDSDLLAG